MDMVRRSAMPTGFITVIVTLSQFYRNQVQFAVANAALGDQGLGKTPHFDGRAAQYGALDTVFVVKMRMQGRHHQIVVRMLDTHQTLGEFAFMMVVHIRQVGHAMRRRILRLPPQFELRPQEIAHRLGSGAITALGNQRIELFGEFAIQGDGESFH